MAPRPVPEGEVERRAAYLAPLRAYLETRGVQPGRVMSKACRMAKAAGLPINTSGRVSPDKLAHGWSVVPPWLVEQCCAVLGLAVVDVMGADWVLRFGADGRGGAETAPVDAPCIRRPYRLHRVLADDGLADDGLAGDEENYDGGEHHAAWDVVR